MAIEKAGVELTAIDSATRIFNQVSSAAKGLEKQYNSLKNTFGGLVASISVGSIVHETVEWEKASFRLNAVLRATGNQAGLTRGQLDEMARSLSESTPFNEQDIRNAESNLLKFGNIHDQVFREALKLSADYAAFTGGNVTSATQAIGRALADPVAGLKALQREFGNLTFTQKEYIAQLEAAGKTEEAQVAVLDIIRSRIGGAAVGSNTGLTGLLGVFAKAWDQVGDAAALAVQKMQGGPSLMGSLAAANGAIPSQGGATASWGPSVAEESAKRASATAKIVEQQNRLNEAHARAVPTLAAWTRQLSDTTREEQALTLVLQGEAKTWTDLDKVKLLNLAVELDRRARLGKELEAEAARVKILTEAWTAADDAQRHFTLSGREVEDQLAFENALIGLTTQQQERLTAARLVDVRARDAIAAGGDRADILSEAQRQKEAILAGLQARRDAERSWATGTKNTFNEYIDHATNAAEQASFLFTNAFKNMEDGLVEFVRTGKLDFRSFADSVIADLIRIQVRQAMAGFASSSGGFFAGLFAGGSSGSTAAMEVHSGGVIGQDGRPRYVHPAYFENAPRMHLGGLAGDEVPAILQRGERVIPRGGSGGVTIYQTMTFGSDVNRGTLMEWGLRIKAETKASVSDAMYRGDGRFRP